MNKYIISFENGQSQIILAVNEDAAVLIGTSLAEEGGTQLLSVVAM